jgi:ribosome maturation factor RimP
MILKEEILKFVEKALSETQFIVDIKISNANDISVFLDDFNGLTIEECKRISRYIETQLDRENEDFSLEVSSPGLSNPFKVKQQYSKSLNKNVEVITTDGEKIIGQLIEVDDNYIILESSKIKKVNNKKQEIKEQHKLEYINIKVTKNLISFK